MLLLFSIIVQLNNNSFLVRILVPVQNFNIYTNVYKFQKRYNEEFRNARDRIKSNLNTIISNTVDHV